MPRVNVWIQEENVEFWNSLENKSGYLNELLAIAQKASE